MTMPDKPQQEHCPNCIRFGLPILPVRYAIARNDECVAKKAPGLQSPFEVESPLEGGPRGPAIPASAATYTLRLLREGYLYVYNQARNQWKAYQVDSYGSLIEFDIRDKAPPLEDGPQDVCSRHGQPVMARCIILPMPNELTTLWLAFSGSPWTPAQLRKHDDKDYRKRHMRQIDVGAWAKAASPQPHLASLYQSIEQVSEFKLAADYKPYAGAKRGIPTLSTVMATLGGHPFQHSLVDCIAFNRGQVDELKAKARECANQTIPGHPQGVSPALVAVDDPVGLAADLTDRA